VRLGTDEKLFDRVQVVTARSGNRIVATGRIAPGEQPVLDVPLHPEASGNCTVTFTASLLRVPAEVQPGSTDTRALGVHYYAFDYAP
jgi:hypothetical protein